MQEKPRITLQRHITRTDVLIQLLTAASPPAACVLSAADGVQAFVALQNYHLHSWQTSLLLSSRAGEHAQTCCCLYCALLCTAGVQVTYDIVTEFEQMQKWNTMLQRWRWWSASHISILSQELALSSTPTACQVCRQKTAHTLCALAIAEPEDCS